MKSSIDIVKGIGEYGRLRGFGASGRWTGLCPFHQEKTPSFSVNQTRQFYKCFGCGVSGDVLKFVMEMDGLTFPETLIEEFGLEYSEPSWDALTRRFTESGIGAAQMEASGLAKKRDSGGFYD